MNNLTKALYYLEDYLMFREIQIEKYLSHKKVPIKKDSPEMDMITDLIKDYWCDLLATGYINNKNQKEKNSIFKSIDIIFPYSEIPPSWIDGIIYVDFVSYSS